MTRLGSIVMLLLALSTPARAATTVTVAGTSGPEAKVGREGAWRPAAAGVTIGEKEFLAIPAGSTVRVTLPDGKVASFEGKIVVPGRRLVSDKTSASNVAWLARAIQNASDAVGGVTASQDGPGAAKPENVGNHPAQKEEARGNKPDARTGGKLGDDKAMDADSNKDSGRTGAKVSAATAATPTPVLTVASLPAAPPPPPPPEADRAFRERSAPEADDAGDSSPTKAEAKKLAGNPRVESLRAGLAAESEGNFETARLMLAKAAVKGPNGEQDVRRIRAEAYVALGRVHLQMGNGMAAAGCFDQAVGLDTVDGRSGPHAARAHYLLGIAALERGKLKRAEKEFGLLSGFPELEAAAKQALSEPRH